jgi:phosphoribosyl-ATP pyrophosphohydrolase/phosphoribosyl-AMP cyclohydrolase
VVEVTADCDGDALLVRARPAGPTCHRGTRSCFEPNAARLELGWLAAVLESRRDADPETSYTARLLARGIERIAQKVGEEGVETAIAAVSASLRGPGEGGERRQALIGEGADLLYHLLVLLQASGVDPAEITEELIRRHGFASSGHS